MVELKFIVLLLFGLAGGSLTAAGFFAVITSIGLINRVAKVTKTVKYLMVYEEFIVAGAVIGNVMSLFNIVLPFNNLSIVNAAGISFTAAHLIIIIFGLLSGVFVGLFVVCLAETTKVLPIFLRRVRIGGGLGIIILMMGLGKAIGELIYVFFLYK